MKTKTVLSLAFLSLGTAGSAFASVQPPVAVPEPGVNGLLIAGLLGLALVVRRRPKPAAVPHA